MIKLRNLTKGYKRNNTIIESPVYSFDRGELTSIVGPNGSGKSTLLMMMAGVLEPTEGVVLVDEHVAGSLPARALLSFVPDKPALFDDLTVAEQMAYVARLNELDEPYEVGERLVEVFEADDLMDRFPRSLSKGQRQKASLMVATSRPFDALLLDEPTSGLDSNSHAGLIDVLSELADSGKLILTSTHTDELIGASTSLAHIVDGRLIDDEELEAFDSGSDLDTDGLG